MNSLDAAEQVLSEAREPLHVREITRRIIEAGLWKTKGLTPEATINAAISVDLQQKRGSSRFERLGRSIYGLRSWSAATASLLRSDSTESFVAPIDHKGHAAENTSSDSASISERTVARSMSFLDAAERVLEQSPDKRPMHYKTLTQKALDLGLIATRGQTPDQTMYAQILTDIDRSNQRGEIPRFAKVGRGKVGLTRWVDYGLAHQIEQHNDEVRRKLRQSLFAKTPTEFEELIGVLLTKIGFEDVRVTGRSGDGGIDVRGTLVVGAVIRTRMAIQAKRWKNNVQAPTVQQVRGSLGAHEQGLIIATSDFSDGARREAARPDAVPVALMNGEQLAALMVQYNIGVRRNPYDLIELGETEDSFS